MNGLDLLLCTWHTTMHHTAISEPVIGLQADERVQDGAHVLLPWTYDHPDFPGAMAMLSDRAYDSFDVRGVTRVFDLTADQAGWSIVLVDPGFSQRRRTTFTGPDSMDGTGELSDDAGGTWQPGSPPAAGSTCPRISTDATRCDRHVSECASRDPGPSVPWATPPAC